MYFENINDKNDLLFIHVVLESSVKNFRISFAARMYFKQI